MSLDPRISAGTTRMLALAAAVLGSGVEPLGWKLGFGAPAALAAFGTDRPLVGFLTRDRLLQSGAPVSVSGWTKPLLEAEVAAHLGAPVSASASSSEALAAGRGLVGGDRARRPRPPPTDIEEVLAGNIFHRHVLLGPVVSSLPTDLSFSVLRDGSEVASTSTPFELTGSLGSILASTASTLAACGAPCLPGTWSSPGPWCRRSTSAGVGRGGWSPAAWVRSGWSCAPRVELAPERLSVIHGRIERMIDDLPDLDAAGLLARASEAVQARRLAEVDDLEVLAQWAAVHSTDPTDGPDGAAARRLGNVLVQVGGDGTPGVQDFCLGEIALARGTGVMASRHALADVLDLQHRLPLTWAVCVRGECEVWVARRVAKLSRHLSLEAVGLVDSAMSRMIATESAGRVLEVTEAKVIEADPTLHDERADAERRRRFAHLGRTDEFGLRMLIARLDAGDAVAVEATVCRVAEIIEPRHPEATPDELRALAFAWLARPAELFALLLEHSDAAPDVEAEQDAGPASEPEPTPVTRALAFPADILDALRTLDLTRLTPRAVLHVHLHEAALHGVDGVVRIEGFGPVTVSRLTELLARFDVKIQPVKDLSERVRYTAYEHPESLRDQVHLVTGGDYWPYASSTSRRVDLDHPTPYDHGAGREPPPDQTGSHNSGPLGRRHHRWKTHAGYRSRQCGEGRYVWLTPNGLAFLVDHAGTHRIHPEKARMILEAPVGVDIYPT